MSFWGEPSFAFCDESAGTWISIVACPLSLEDGTPCVWGAATRWRGAVRPSLPSFSCGARRPQGTVGRCFAAPPPKRRRWARGSIVPYIRHDTRFVPKAEIANEEPVSLLPDSDDAFWAEFEVLDA